MLHDEAHPNVDKASVDSYRSGGMGGLHAGDRAPDAPGLVAMHGSGVTKLFDLYDPSYHSILIFAESIDTAKPKVEDALNAITGKYANARSLFKLVVILPKQDTDPTPLPLDAHEDFVLEDRNGLAREAFDFVKDGFEVVAVRPDGMIGAIARSGEGLEAYLTKVLI
jgi:hypothetical protein